MAKIIDQRVWTAKNASETVELNDEFSKYITKIIELTFVGFSGTIDFQGKSDPDGAYANIVYTPYGVGGSASVAQLSYTTETSTKRFIITDSSSLTQIVMTRSAGTVSCYVTATDIEQDETAVKAVVDTISTDVTGVKAKTDLITTAPATEATLTAIKGVGWSTETLKALGDLIAAIPTTAMRGTDNAALASVLGALADAANTGAVGTDKTAMAYLKQLVTAILLIPTTAMRGTDNAALASVVGALADTANSGAVGTDKTAMAYLKQLVTLLLLVPTTAMRGTDNAALASVVGALADAAAEGAVTEADTAMAYIKQLVTLLIETQKDADYVEEHLHHKTRWYGKKSDQTTYWCDIDSLTPYRAISGSGAYGGDANDEAKLFSSADTLSELGTGLVNGDFDMILIVANSSDTVYKLRIVWGSGTLADAVTAGQYSELMYIRKSTDTVRLPREFKCPKIPVSDKVWLQCLNASDNATIDFFIGTHAYDF